MAEKSKRKKNSPKTKPRKDAEVQDGPELRQGKVIKDLLSKGNKKGYLSYKEINHALPEKKYSAQEIEEVIIKLTESDIKLLNDKEVSYNTKPLKGSKGATAAGKTIAAKTADYGSAIDPVKMYLREMGLVTLLSREGEVEIAKKIEAGEHLVLRALLETKVGVECILSLGEHIEAGHVKSKYVLRDIEEGDTYVDEILQTDQFHKTISEIRKLPSSPLRLHSIGLYGCSVVYLTSSLVADI